LEYINRARANPAAEGVLLANPGTDHPEVQSAYDYFGVDLAKMMDEFAAMEPAPPLSFNALLIQAARSHSQDMLDNVFQGHYSWDTSTDSADWSKGPGYRLDQVNYPWSRYGENVFAFAKTPFHGHAGFEVDWGPNPDGMQGPPRGHRENLHNPSFREIGIGVLNGSNTADRDPFDVGPQLVTQDLASRFNLDPFITGVVYEDLNDNDFYDVGEGLGGVTVDVAGSQFHAVTASSGGYSVPVPANRSHTVTFSGARVTPYEQTVTVATDNVKVDYQAVRGEPVVTIGTVAPAPGGGLRIECSVAGGSAASVRLEYLDDLTSTWAEETSAQLDVIEAGVRYGFDVPVGTTGRRFYQVVVQ
jgi:hypothetical protein